MGDSLQKINTVVDFRTLAQAVEQRAPRPVQPKGGASYPIEVMERILVVKRLHGVSDEQAELQLPDRRSFQRSLRPSSNG